MTKSVTLPLATDSASIIAKHCISMATGFNVAPDDYRGVGIQMTKLESAIRKQKPVASILQFATKASATATKVKDKDATHDNSTTSTIKRRIECSVLPSSSGASHVKVTRDPSSLPVLPDLPDDDSSHDADVVPSNQQGAPAGTDFMLPTLSQVCK